MNTRGWIEVIPSANKKHLVLYSDLIAQYTENGNSEMVTEYAKKMRGYLECMKDIGTITDGGLKALYLYYRSTRVDSRLLEKQINDEWVESLARTPVFDKDGNAHYMR